MKEENLNTRINILLTFIFSEIKSIWFVCDNFFQVHNIVMIQLSKDFDLSHCCDRKTFLLIVSPYFFQGNQFPC